MWQARVDEDLKGKFYTFNVKIDDVWQGDTPGLMAKAVGVNGDRAASSTGKRRIRRGGTKTSVRR